MLKQILSNVKILGQVSECLQNNIRLSLHGLTEGEKAILLYGLKQQSIVVCSTMSELDSLKISLCGFGLNVKELTYCPTSHIASYKQDQSIITDFVSAINEFRQNKIDVLLLLVDATMQRLPSRDFFEQEEVFCKGKSYSFNNLANTFSKFGYKRCDYVTTKGEFAIRGDIVDIFLIDEEYPTRLDFFGDEIQKINNFDLDTMQTINILEQIKIYPINIFENVLNYKDNILSIFNDKLIFFDEPKKLIDDFNNIYLNNKNSIQSLINKGELGKEYLDYYFNFLDFIPNKYCLFENILNNYFVTEKQINFRNIGAKKYVFNYKSLANDLNIYLSSNYKIFLFCGSEESVKSIGQLLLSFGLNYTTEYDARLPKGQIILTSEVLEYSASFLESGIILIATSDLVKRTRIVATKAKRRMTAYLPKVGDYVVHTTHGIGKCQRIEKLNLNGTEKDYFVIEYKGGTLYLPSEQTDLISAYLGGESEPKLNKIGGQEFAKIKQKVKDSVKQLAFDLVKLYAEREKQKGVIFEPSYVFDEFENAFDYELTTDQQKAIMDIKQDMYSGKIMDRLICGDVGYGKTEVALRAAFICVLGGKQVAFLCPTTILSEQHFKTTLQRTKDFGCRVEVLNRFCTKQKTEDVLKRLQNGEIDILIGTHRLLSDDVKFKDLGLLILDEEHRFGVEDKEKIKNIKKDINVLTLSATPIPRTLNMAMTGIRDITVIETAPKNRLPVQTFVLEENDLLIQDACKKELARGGQVLIVFNRVDKIYAYCEKIKELLPTAKVGLAHGQMPTKILEDAIIKLYNGELDILVATTLIENGIDLPRANTLIVIEADKLGLSQLYQLKGRIGRSDKLGFAYFTFNPNKILTADAYKRLDAIMEFTELGSGFKIAMRDLEIRGAGNILGKEQHGHMAKVGYDLYTKILGEVVREIKGQKEQEKLEYKVDISCPAYLDEDYIKTEEERVKQYSDISQIESLNQLDELLKNTTDTYGEPSQELQNLYKIALIKNLGVKISAKRIFVNDDFCKIYLHKSQEKLSQNIVETIAYYKNICVLKFDEMPIIDINIKNITMQNKIEFLIKFLLRCTNSWFLIDFLIS